MMLWSRAASLAAGWDKHAPAAKMSLEVAGAASVTLQIGGTEQRVEIASFAEISGLSESDEKPVVETEAEIIR